MMLDRNPPSFFSPNGYLLILTLFTENTILSPLPCRANSRTQKVSLNVSCIYPVPMIYLPIFIPMLHCFNYYSLQLFSITFKITASTIFLFLSTLTLLGSIHIVELASTTDLFGLH